MENIGQKKKLCEKKVLRQKWLWKMHLKNVVITYNSLILRLRYNKKFLTKKMRNETFKCSKFSLYSQQKNFD